MRLFLSQRGAALSVIAGFLAGTTPAFAQSALPTIDVGRQKPVRAAHAQPPRGGKPSHSASVSSPRESAAPVTAPVPAALPIDAVAQPPKENNTTYNPPNTFSATKTNTPIMDTPASVQVIPRAVINDVGAINVNQSLNLVSGVLADDPNQTLGSTIIRGFQTFDYYRDGVRMNTNFTSMPASLANVDRMEVLKGPASVLYGRAEPGGLINIVTKQPLDEERYVVEQQGNSWADYRTTLDATGPLTKDKSLLYRVNVSSEQLRSFQQFSGGQDYFVAPTFRWNIDNVTYANVYADFHYRGTTDYVGPPAYTNARDTFAINGLGVMPSAAFGDVPISFLPRYRNFVDPWTRGNNDDIVAGFNWSHDLNEDWNVRQRFQTEINEYWHKADFSYGLDYYLPSQLDRAASASYTESHVYFTSVDLTGKLDTVGIGHTLLAGSDFQRLGYANDTVYFPAPNIDMFWPAYTTVPLYSIYPFAPGNTPARFVGHENWWGVYLQDQMKLPLNLFLLAGGRYDHATTYDAVAGQTFDNSQRVTPRFGLLWRPVPQISVYGSYLTNFGASNTFGARPLPPQTAQQWELGVKTELLENRVTATFAYYDLTKQHLPVPDPNPALAAQGFMVAVGEVRHKGAEFDLAGEVLPGWRIIAAYSYINSVITKDSVCTDPANYGAGCAFDAFGNLIGLNGTKGNQLFGVPRHSGSLWTTYEFQTEELRGLKIGGGSIARSLAQGDNNNDFHTPGFATLQAMASYQMRVLDHKTTFQLNVNNLLNTRYTTSTNNSPVFVNMGVPRTFQGSIKMEF